MYAALSASASIAVLGSDLAGYLLGCVVIGVGVVVQRVVQIEKDDLEPPRAHGYFGEPRLKPAIFPF